jgi:hypothetical protein
MKTKHDQKKEAIRELWRRGTLDYILHDKQKEIKNDLLTRREKISTILCARRFGKTFVLLNMAIELCIKKPNAIVKYISPQLKQSKQNLKENMPFLLKGCPKALIPEWKENDKKYIFPNGSEIQVAGTDNGSHESLRGGRADMCIVDEAGFCDHLDYVVKSILRPTTLTTGGKIYLVSTPSKIYTHEFIQLYVLPAKLSGTMKTYTIYDNPMLTQQDIDELVADYIDGVKNPAFRREYLCEMVNDSTSIVVDEFTEERKAKIVKVLKQPAYLDAYTSGDVGFKDLTVYLFAYWDFINARVVIEDELVLSGVNTNEVAKGIKEYEAATFKDGANQPLPIYMRVMDNNLTMVNDLQTIHGLPFIPTQKHNKEAYINQVKIMIANEQIMINPKCKHLIYHLESATWNRARTEFERIPDSVDGQLRGGHADALDALIYLVRNLVRSKNPYPEGWGIDSGQDVFKSRAPAVQSGMTNAIKKILNIKSG